MNIESLQDFYTIINNQTTNAFFIKDIEDFWISYKDNWFNGLPIYSSSFQYLCMPYTNSINEKFQLLLHYDQIIRHPHPDIENPISNSNKKLCLRFATQLAFQIIHEEKEFACMPSWKKIFILLTIRHNPTMKMKQLALKKIYNELENDSSNSLYLRFLKATVWDINKMKICECSINPISKCNLDKIKKSEIQAILETPLPYTELEDLDFKKVYDKMFSSILYGIHEYMNNNQIDKKDMMTEEPKRIGVSISGGVDSMVLSAITKEVANQIGIQVILIHISYNNRVECKEEIELLQYWATLLDLPLYVISIDEIKRNRSSNWRSLYEEITRKIRFSFYKKFNCPILLGHNKDDMIENIFTNLANKTHFKNLFGMTTISQEECVSIIRPFLEIEKIQIRKYADLMKIPHLYDSTPKWCNRGRIRDNLVPIINEFDNRILKGLYEYIKYNNFLEFHYQKQFDEWLCELNIKQYEYRHFNSSKCKKENLCLLYVIPRLTPNKEETFFENNKDELNFWIQLWFQLFKRKPEYRMWYYNSLIERFPILDGISRPSNKSFQNAIQGLNIGVYPREIQLSKKYLLVIEYNRIEIWLKNS